MKRIGICSYGPLPQCVRFAEGDLPAVGDHDILVKVVAVSVNPIDYKIVLPPKKRTRVSRFFFSV